MSAKRAMQVVNNAPPVTMYEGNILFGFQPSEEDLAKYFYMAVHETPGAAPQVPFYGNMGYEVVQVVCQNPLITVMRIPHEKRAEREAMDVQRAKDQSRSAMASARQAVAGAAGVAVSKSFDGVKDVETGIELKLPMG